MRWTDAEYAAYQRRVEDRHPDTLFEPTETDFLAQVRRILKEAGYLVYHTHDSRGSEPGFPDLVATNGSRLLFIELKTRTGKLTIDQTRWLALLRHTGTEVYVLRPHDLEWFGHQLERRGGKAGISTS